MDLVYLFKGLSDPTRFRITHLLCQNNELCVCHLTDALALPQSTVSRHLSTLRNYGVVKAERRGKWMYYKMDDAQPTMAAMIELIKIDANSNDQLQSDLSKLKNITC